MQSITPLDILPSSLADLRLKRRLPKMFQQFQMLARSLFCALLSYQRQTEVMVFSSFSNAANAEVTSINVICRLRHDAKSRC